MGLVPKCKGVEPLAYVATILQSVYHTRLREPTHPTKHVITHAAMHHRAPFILLNLAMAVWTKENIDV